MAKLISIALTCLLLAEALADGPIPHMYGEEEFNADLTRDTETSYRLPESVRPISYIIEITPHFEANDNRAEFTFDGTVEIDVELLTSNLTQIVLHQNVLVITEVALMNNIGQAVTLASPAWELDLNYNLLKIDAPDVLDQSVYRIIISYIGRIHEIPLDRGFFRGYYFENGLRKWYATTHFQPYHARKAFPCFDEPALKATFTLIMNRPANYASSISNMAIANTTINGDYVRETFYPTPIMSTYLLTFHVSEMVVVADTPVGSSKPFAIIARPEGSGQGEYALEVGQEITQWMDDYFGIPYYDMAEGMQNDHMAIPDFAAGATENWGAVSYREMYLLYDEADTSLSFKQFIATIIAHELAHKWFGNIVTCFWWSNTWINEGFASYFEYFAAHGVDEAYELDDQFIVDYVHSALSSDSSTNSPPLNNPAVITPTQITAHFNTITYAKGASVLRMMENLIGPSTFKKALNYFLLENLYGTGTQADMYSAFERAVSEDGSLNTLPGVSITSVFSNWIDQSGYPVMNVDVNMENGDMTITQERFYINGDVTSEDIYMVPITYTTGGNPDWTNTKANHALTERSTVINKGDGGHEWVIFNIGVSAFYRVNYDDHTWDMIEATLKTQIEDINYMNRAQIVDDLFNLMRADRVSLQRFLNIYRFLESESSYFTWKPAITAYNWLLRRVVHDDELSKKYQDFILQTMETVIADVGLEETVNDSTSKILNRMQILNLACTLGHQGCVDYAVSTYNALKTSGISVPVNARRYVYCTALRLGDETDYEFIWNRYLTSNIAADQFVMLRTLACTLDQTKIAEYLQQTLVHPLIRVQDRNNAFLYVLQGNEENIPTALQFVQDNYDDIRIAYGGTDRLATVLSNLALYFTNEDDLTSYSDWLTQNQAAIPEYASGLSGVASARSNLQWSSDNVDDIQIFLASGVDTIVASTVLVISFILGISVQNFIYYS